uniref:VWFD domain-containing protein n=1 Tax=Timema cristinae TaxID=61476 RepID=A0A7R9CAY1_TIMCR|nr:unnamed protein product [Timema cristinae]
MDQGRLEYRLGEKGVHPTEIRTSISPSSAVELNTSSALANYANEAGSINTRTMCGLMGKPRSNMQQSNAKIFPTPDLRRHSCDIGVQIPLELSLLLTTEDVTSSDLLELLPSKKLTLKLLLVHKVANSSSVLRSWDINTVYTTSRGFTEHDLKVKVTRLLGQTISHRLCLEADAWFPEWDPERPTTHLVKGQMNVAWGVVDDSKCPRDSSGLRVTVRAELSDEQSVLGDNKSYRACHVDSSGKEGLLLTEACSWVAREMATMRKYTANFRYTKLPEVLLSAGDYLISLLEVLYPGVTPDSSEYGVMVTAEFPMSRPEMKLTMNKRRTTVSVRQPWLLNTLYSPGLALATRYRIINWCIMNSTNLRTFDEAFLELTIPLCYTLASADNSKQPTFAVFVRKVAEKDALAVKFYIGNNFVEIIPNNEGKLDIFVNKEQIKHAEQSYQYSADQQTYDFELWKPEEGRVLINSRLAHVWLEYKGHTLSLAVPGLYNGILTGLCGDSNGHAGNYNLSYHTCIKLYFLIAKFLASGPCQNTAEVLRRELENKKVLPKRLDWEGNEHDQTFEELERKFPHLGPTYLLEICRRIGPILDKDIKSNVPGVESLLGAGRQSLLRTVQDRGPQSWGIVQYSARKRHVSFIDPPGYNKQHNIVRVLQGRETSGPLQRRQVISPRLYSKQQLLCRTVGHLSAVYCLLFDCSGRYIITGADDLLVKIWSAIDGRLMASLRGASAEITDIAINDENTLLAAGSLDKLLRVWNLQTSAPVAVLAAHTGMITSVNFCPLVQENVQYLVTTSTDGSVAFWSYQQMPDSTYIFQSKPVQYNERMRPGQAQMICASFSPGGVFMAAGSADHHVRHVETYFVMLIIML